MDKTRILLISANPEVFPYHVYPLALPRLAAALKSRGYGVSQYDLLLGSLSELERKIVSEKPFLIGVSLRNIDNTDSNTQKSYIDGYTQLVSRIKTVSQAPIVLGGSGFSIFPEELMTQLGADYGVKGRGEETLCDLADAVSKGMPNDGGDPLSACRPNLYSKRELNPNPSLSRTASPSKVHYGPEHEKEILESYWRRSGMIGVQTKTGCPMDCVYCTYPLIEGKKQLFFEADQVAEEVARLKTDFGVGYVFFVDSIFNTQTNRELELAEALIKRNMGIKWGAFFTPSGIQEEYLATLKRSGLTHIELGSDSFSDEVLAAYRKNFRYNDIVQTSVAALKVGIPVAHYLIFGGPGETAETIQESFRKSRELKKTVFFATLGMRIYPGTALARLEQKERAGSRVGNALSPVFYFAPGLEVNSLEEMIKKEAGSATNWVLPGDYMKENEAMARLRKLGKSGPLWEYLCR
jgi:radical SAM superfamily enzyme YgiQ (UPF0313 family)